MIQEASLTSVLVTSASLSRGTCSGMHGPKPCYSVDVRLPGSDSSIDNLDRLGIKTRIFHLGDYRRATIGAGGEVPQDYFYPNASPASVMLRQKILKKCREDIYSWLNHENGQVAIYDAVNPTASGRRSLAKELAKHDVSVRKPAVLPGL